jgi:NAD(P)H-flavin reductase
LSAISSRSFIKFQRARMTFILHKSGDLLHATGPNPIMQSCRQKPTELGAFRRQRLSANATMYENKTDTQSAKPTVSQKRGLFEHLQKIISTGRLLSKHLDRP